MEILHQSTFYLLYAGLAVLLVFAVERGLFFMLCYRDFGQVQQAGHPAAAACRDTSIPGYLIQSASASLVGMKSKSRADDLTEKLFIEAQRRLTRHLWLFDTIITAAPLLGLLGTILGIYDTFNTLARSGISDAQGVSAGIGTALLATALGIVVALIGVVFHNLLQDHAERLGDNVKVLLLDLQPEIPS